MQHLTTETVIDYLHGELAPGEDARVLAHIESCADCTRELEIEAALTERVRAAARAEELELPLGFAAAIAARIGEPARGLARLRPAFLLSALGFAAMAAALVVVPLARHSAAPGHALPVSYLLEEHAAHAQENPLGDRSATQIITAGFERGPGGDAPLIQAADSSLSNDGDR